MKPSISLLFIYLCFCTGCENKWDKMSDEDLEEKYYECLRMKNPQPGTAIACENIKEEYAERHEK